LCAAALCAAAPAEAQDRARTAPGHNPALTGVVRSAPGRAQPFSGQESRIRFANEGILREDGTPGNRRSVVGSMPLLGPLAAEVGLFSVAGASPKEREAKGGDRVIDLQPRRSRVAAVGLRMSF
jgi:hypothetical protein